MSYPAEAGDDDELAPGTLVGEYEIENLLGRGGMGEVYGAHHPVIGKRVAVKVMNKACSASPVNVDRFVQEAKAVNAIGHANIVDIFSFGKTADGRCYFVMEWLQGTSLRDAIDRAAPTLETTRALDILDAVLRALEAAHTAGIVHRDLKPDNIFLVAARDGEPERVKLLDFGIAKLADDGTGARIRASRTTTGTVIGTPSYMAPEQAAGGTISGQSDVYSLGVVAFELFTGETPFREESAVQIMAAHLDKLPPRPSSIRAMPSGIEALILDMLAKAERARPTPAEARQQIARLRSDPGTVTTGVSFTKAKRAKTDPVIANAATTPLTPVLKLAFEPRSPRPVVPVATPVATMASEGGNTMVRRTRSRTWLIVGVLALVGVAAIAFGAYTSRSHAGRAADASASATGSATEATPSVSAPGSARVPDAVVVPTPTPTPTASATLPTPTPTPVAPAPRPVAKGSHVTVLHVAPAKPLVSVPAAPTRRPDVDSVRDPFATDGSNK